MRDPFHPATVNSRIVLLAGFGGLLILTALAGADGLKALQEIETSNDRARDDFVLRTRVLERIRSDLYRSGTDVRDYLLEPEPGRAEGHRYTLIETRRDMDSALDRYRGLLSGNEKGPFDILTRELTDYWQTLDPVFQWSAPERRRAGYAFLRDEVFPRRTSMLGIADQIGRLNEAQLEMGRVTVQTTFREFRKRLLAAVGLTIGLGFVLAWFSVRKILSLEAATARQYGEINHARSELRQLSARLLEAQEEERRSISRELHDEVGQALSGVLLEMANLSKTIGPAHPASAAAAEIKRLLEGAIGVVRNMALLLRPSMLDDLGLVPALQWQAREASKRSGVWVTVTAENVPETLGEEQKTCVYRVVQEALHNAVQHAGARKVTVTVTEQGGTLLLAIEDDGRGFNPQLDRGMGLLGIEERVGSLGGSLAIQSAPGHGTVLRVELPMARPALASAD